MISQQDTRILKYLIETSHQASMPYSTEWHGSVSINMINIQIFLFLTNCQSFILPPRPLGVSAWMKYTGWCRITGYYYFLGRLSISQKKVQATIFLNIDFQKQLNSADSAYYMHIQNGSTDQLKPWDSWEYVVKLIFYISVLIK